MTQPDIPIQGNESDEVAALRALAGAAGWCVTHTTDGGHAKGSLHKVAATNGTGRAVDLGDRRGGVSSPPTPEQAERLLAINEAVIRLVPVPLISELIYGGVDGICVKNGRRVDGRVVYSAVIDDHRDHVHLAVVKGFTYTSQEPHMPDDPNVVNAQAPIVAAFPTPTGKGYTMITADGAVFCFGDAEYHGRIEAPTT